MQLMRRNRKPTDCEKSPRRRCFDVGAAFLCQRVMDCAVQIPLSPLVCYDPGGRLHLLVQLIATPAVPTPRHVSDCVDRAHGANDETPRPSLRLRRSCRTRPKLYAWHRGIPGRSKGIYGAHARGGPHAYRNLALHRPAYQSSAYDYNLTAQLITDGIKGTTMPQWIETSTSDRGVLPKNQREIFLDGNVTSSLDVSGDSPWVEFDLKGGGEAPEIDRIDLYLRKISGRSLSGTWTYTVLGSDDDVNWKEVGRASGSQWPDMRAPGPSFFESIPFAAPAGYRYYRVQLSAPNLHTWGVAELALFDKGQSVRVAGPDLFSSAWMSAGGGEEWVYVDLGAVCTFDHIAFSWVARAMEGEIQVSDDAGTWKTLQALPASRAPNDDIDLARPARGRYVRLLMTKPEKPRDRYILSELEVYGRGGFTARPHAPALVDAMAR